MPDYFKLPTNSIRSIKRLPSSCLPQLPTRLFPYCLQLLTSSPIHIGKQRNHEGGLTAGPDDLTRVLIRGLINTLKFTNTPASKKAFLLRASNWQDKVVSRRITLAYKSKLEGNTT